MRRVLFLAVCAFALGCGYSADPLYRDDDRRLAIPVFKNRTFWRGVEFELTDQVVRAFLTRAPYQITHTDRADMILEGTVVGFRLPVLVEGPTDQIIESSVLAVVKVELRDARTGRIVASWPKLTYAAEFNVARGDNEEGAREEAFRKLAEKIVYLMETPWTAEQDAAGASEEPGTSEEPRSPEEPGASEEPSQPEGDGQNG